MLKLKRLELRVSLAGLKLEHPILPAAGICKTKEEAQEVIHSAAAVVVLGSITVLPRLGNKGNILHLEPQFSLNSIGLRNPGREYYQKYLPSIAAEAHDAGKPLIVSVAGFTPQEYATLATVAVEGGADAVELNWGCANVWGDNGHIKPIPSFHPDVAGESLNCVIKAVGRETCISVKVSPLPPPLLQELARVILNSRAVDVVTAINAVPYCLGYDSTGVPLTTPADGLAAMGGPAVKQIGLGQIRQWRATLPARISLIGTGGVEAGADVIDYQRAGADAVSLATAYFRKQEQNGRGAEIFGVVLGQYLEELVKPGGGCG